MVIWCEILGCLDRKQNERTRDGWTTEMSHEGILFSIELPPVYSNLIDTNQLISRLLTRANCVQSSIDREIHQSEMEICVADVFSWERFRCRIYFLAIFSRSEQKKIEESDRRLFLDLVLGCLRFRRSPKRPDGSNSKF